MSDSIQNKRRSLIKVGLAAGAVAGTGAAPMPARAVDSPSQPLHMQVAFPAGGPTDVVMRVLADNASKVFGQPVVVENRPCAGGTLPAQALQTAKPDGYTVGQTPLGIFRLPYTTKITWDPVKDLSYIICVTGYSFGIVVPTSSPIQTWADYVAYAKANPGKLSYGSTGTLISPHLTVEDIAQRSGIMFNHIPYKGRTELMQVVLGGHVISASDSTGFAPHVASGKLRELNTWGEKRLAKFPDAPTLKELGLPIVQTSPYGLAAPKGTDPAIVKRLHDGFKQAMDMQSYHDVLAKYDQELIYMNSAQYTKFAEETFRREKALIEKLGLNKPA